MGLETQSNSVFLTIGSGKIVREVKAPTSISKERINKKGRTVHEEIYDRITGIITGIKSREHEEYGKSWNITLADGNDNFTLQIKQKSAYISGFLKALPNVDLTKPVTIIPSLKQVDGKDRGSLFLSQNGQSLKWFYTREHPNGLPELQQVKIGGKIQWDDFDQMEFLEKMVNNEIVPKLPRVAASAPAPVAEPVPAVHEDEDMDPGAAPVATSDGKMPF